MRIHVVFFVWTNLFYMVICDAEVRIRLSNTEDVINSKSEDGCCKYELGENTACKEQCILTFRTCINQVESVLSRTSCSTLNSTGEFKIRVPGSLKAPFYLTLELRANGRLVDRYQSDIVSDQWIHGKDLIFKDLKSTRRKASSPSGLRINVSIACGSHFYGNDCSVQCVDADECSGHFTCNQETGEKICRTGWTGKDCTENVEGHLTCPDSVICENGGTCMLNTSAQTVKDLYICCPNRSNVNEVNISNSMTKQSRRKTEHMYPCPRNKCRNFGKCVAGKCVCKKEFQGELCQTDTTEIKITRPDNCPSCTFNNSCVSKSFPPLNVRANTNCPENMYGMNCEKRCVPKNSCRDGHYTCDKATGDKICLNGWGGPDCNIRNISKECDSECPKTSCKNDGVCFNGLCCCKEGLYTGKYCETEILMCDQNPCQNNAKCFNVQNDYTCECQNGYSGRNCENNLNPTSHKSTVPTTSRTTESATSKQTASATIYEGSTTMAVTTTSSTTASPTYSKVVITEPTTVISTTTVLPTTSSSSASSSLPSASSLGLELPSSTNTFAPSTPSSSPKSSTSPAKSSESPSRATTFKRRTTSSAEEATTSSISSSAGLHSASISRTTQTPRNTGPTDNLSLGVDISNLSATTVIPSILQTTTEQSIPEFQVYISGNIDNKDKDKLEKLINQSLTVCSSQNTEIVDMRHLISDNGAQVTNVSYAVHGCSNLTDRYTDSNFTMRLNQLLQSSETFQHNRLYGSSTDELKDLSFSYYINLIGYVYSSNLKTIKDTLISVWAISNPDIPEVDILVILRDYYLGDYGIYVRKLSYFVTSKGQLLSPSSIEPPSLPDLQNKFNGKDSVLNKLYTGRMLILYKNTLRLNIRNGEMSKSKLYISLNKVWSRYIKANLGEGNKSMNFTLSKAEPCSFLKKTNVYSVVYAPVWRSTGTQVDISPPPVLSTSEFSLCECQPKRQFYVDILGRVKLRDRASVEAQIAKTWERVKVASKINDEEAKYTRLTALRTAEWKPVTRLWFIQPDKSHDNTESWPNPNMGNRLAGIEKNLAVMNRSISYVRTEKWYNLVLDGDEKNDKEDKIKGYLISSWVEQNTEISEHDVKIRIMEWSSKYFCSQSKIITLVQYTVSVSNADSIETSLEEPNKKVYDKTFSHSGVAILHCTPRYQREFGLLGTFGPENKTDLENAIQHTWTQLNNGVPVNITAHITKLTPGFTSETGDKATKVQYYIDLKKDDKDVDEEDIDEPDKSKLQKEIKSRFPGIAILSLLLTESPVKEDKNTKSWIYPLIVVACVLVLVAFIAALFGFIRYQRHRDSKTLTQDPEEVDEYDKEHFSEEPEMDNSSLSLEETMDDQENHKTYIVN